MRGSIRLGVVTLALALGSPALVMAQGKPAPAKCGTCAAPNGPKCQVCGQPLQNDADIDRKLDESLRKAHGGTGTGRTERPTRVEQSPRTEAPLGAEPELHAEPEPDPLPPPKAKHDDDDDNDPFRVTLGLFAAHWAPRIFDIHVGGGRNGSYGMHVPLSRDRSNTVGEVSELERAQTQMYRGWLCLGNHVSIDGGARGAIFRDDSITQRSFNFRNVQHNGGDSLSTKFEFLTADLNLNVHPVAGKWGRLDLIMGGRYIFTGVQIRNRSSGTITEQRLEAFVPMIGLGGSFRPIHARVVQLELYARARIGGFKFEERGVTRSGRRIDREFKAVSADAEGGVSLIIRDTIGVTLGYRFELVEIERRDRDQSKEAAFKVGGPFAGVFLQF